MEERFLEEWHKLTRSLPASDYILAISGGVDSVVLARLLADSGIEFSLAHCNFNLRGEESIADEEFVKALAAELAVDLHLKSFETTAYANKQGVSIQMAARELRYIWFSELIANKGARLIIAHHANDVAETMLFNLTKGTGLAGLHGIRAVDEHKIRPMLWTTKNEILAYAKKRKLIWREDQSNAEPKYARNRIRHTVVPELEKINPSFVTAAVRTASRIADTEELIDYTIEQQALSRYEGNHLFIDKKKLGALPGRATVLYRLISSYGYNYDQVESIIKSIDSVGATFPGPSAVLNIDRHDIIISDLDSDPELVQVEAGSRSFNFNDEMFKCRKIGVNDYVIQTNPEIAALDYDKLHFPLIVRTYHQGERFQPLGMAGKKLISDFLIDEKVPVNLKRIQGVVASADTISWVIGRRIDDRFRVSEETKHVFEISRQPDSG